MTQINFGNELPGANLIKIDKLNYVLSAHREILKYSVSDDEWKRLSYGQFGNKITFDPKSNELFIATHGK